MPIDGVAKRDKCPNCWKPDAFCICREIPSLSSSTRVVVLQHPREARNPLNTARLLSLSLGNSIHKVGLSWPSLKAVVGRPVQPSRWGVLFLGNTKEHEKAAPKLRSLEGIVLLDGNWKQSKTLWWRNPWLTRLQRIRLAPSQRSIYDRLRHQPRESALCTIEAAAEIFVRQKSPEISNQLTDLLRRFIERVETQTQE